jgi:hypothetical protein
MRPAAMVFIVGTVRTGVRSLTARGVSASARVATRGSSVASTRSSTGRNASTYCSVPIAQESAVSEKSNSSILIPRSTSLVPPLRLTCALAFDAAGRATIARWTLSWITFHWELFVLRSARRGRNPAQLCACGNLKIERIPDTFGADRPKLRNYPALDARGWIKECSVMPASAIYRSLCGKSWKIHFIFLFLD